jgi:hypothetical protein
MADLDLPYSRVQHVYGKSDDEETRAKRKTVSGAATDNNQPREDAGPRKMA